MNAETYLNDYQILCGESFAWQSIMKTLTPIVRPVREEIGRSLMEGSRRARNIYDATGIVATNDLGSAIYGSASNPADKWFVLGTDDPDFNKWPKAKSALTAMSRITLNSYGPTWSAFYAQSFPLYLDIAGLGQGFFYQAERHGDDDAVDGFTDKCLPLSECEFRIDDEGRVTHFYRKFKLTLLEAKKLAEARGGTLSPQSEEKFKAKPQDVIEILHATCRNDEYNPERIGPVGQRFASVHIEIAQKFEMARKGFRSMPFYAPAWERAAGERRGRGAGEMAMADILSLQVMARGNLMGGEWAANPALGGPHDSNLNISRMRPGSFVPGAFNMRGEQLLGAIHKGAGTPFSLEMANQLREAIKAAFGAAIMGLVPTNRTGLDPSEVLDLREERFRRMAPYQGNITAGFLDPHVRRRVELCEQNGAYAGLDIPKDLRARVLHPQFTSPAALAQAAARASSAVRATGALVEAAQMDPSIGDRFNGDGYFQTVANGYGVPEIMNDDNVTEQRREARLKQQNAAAMAEIADKAAGAAQKGAGAVATLRSPPPGA